MKQTIIRTAKTICLTVVTLLLFSVVLYQMWSQVFPKDEAIERAYPRIEQARKDRAAYFESLPDDELKKNRERVQAELRAQMNNDY